MPCFSGRFSWDLSLNSLTLASAEKKRQGVALIDLTEANPTRAELAYPREQILRALSRDQLLDYRPEPFGLLEARQAVARYYTNKSAPVSADQVILTASTSEAYSWIFQLLCDPGDEILEPRPSYPLFDFLARLQLCRPSPYHWIQQDARWMLDPSTLPIAAGPRCRAAILVHPNNPTGHYVSSSDREALEKFTSTRGIALIADEVFHDFSHSPAVPPSFASRANVLTFTLSGLSKVAALPQLKLAWIVVSGPERDVEPALERLEVIADTYLSVGTPVQLATASLLEEVAPVMRQTLRERLAENLHTIRSLTADTSVRLLEPEGGWYALLKTTGPVDEESCVRLLQATGVLVHPASFFGFSDDRYIVLSLLPQPPLFHKGVQRLIEWLS